MKYNIPLLSIVMTLLSLPAFAEDTSGPFLRAGAGAGINYGAGVGINNELVLNNYISAQFSAGYLDHIGWGTGVALTGYPVGNTGSMFSPRVSVHYGRVGVVDMDEGASGHRYAEANGFAAGIGGQFPLFSISKMVGNIDVYYTDPKLPAGFTIKDRDHVKFSAGVAYSFGGM